MTSEPVSKMPDPKYAVTTDSDGISGLEPMTEAEKAHFRAAPCYLCGYNGAGYYQPDTHACAARYHATDEDFIKALKSERDAAIAQLDEARAERAIVAEHVRKLIPEGQDKSQADNPYGVIGCIAHFRERAEAAEARLEEAKAVLGPFVAAFERCQPDEDEIRYGARQLHELKDDECAMIFPTAASLRAARAFLRQGGEDAR